jgi:hypothetical protein
MMITDAVSYSYQPVRLSSSPLHTHSIQDWLQEILPSLLSPQDVSLISPLLSDPPPTTDLHHLELPVE